MKDNRRTPRKQTKLMPRKYVRDRHSVTMLPINWRHVERVGKAAGAVHPSGKVNWSAALELVVDEHRREAKEEVDAGTV